MRASILALMAIAGSAGVAAADDEPPCKVLIVRAPEGVHEAIERWVAGEIRCAGTLQVRVVQTQAGLYVVANDGAHHTFDRFVPDAESAGALVASWAAADATPRLKVRTTVRDDDDDDDAGDDDEVASIEVVDGPPTAAPGRDLLVGAGYTLAQGGSYARVELDAVRTGAWSVGGAGHVYHCDCEVQLDTQSASLYVAWASKPGDWRVRAAAGAGVAYVDLSVPMYGYSSRELHPVLEASALVSRQLSARWALSAGPTMRHIVGNDGIYGGDLGGYLAARITM